MILAASDREFNLGADERIVGEYEGIRVVGATVVKSRDLEGD